MVWDLRGALLKKGEFESARLAAFDFKLRVRAFRLLAAKVGEDPDEWTRRTVHKTDSELLEMLAPERPDLAAELPSELERCMVAARRQLIAEEGDPTPHRLL